MAFICVKQRAQSTEPNSAGYRSCTIVECRTVVCTNGNIYIIPKRNLYPCENDIMEICPSEDVTIQLLLFKLTANCKVLKAEMVCGTSITVHMDGCRIVKIKLFLGQK